VNQTGNANVLSRDEIAEAIRLFTHADWARLRKVAKKYNYCCSIDPDDLVQEACLRAFEDGEDRKGRKCPRNVSVVRFLAEAVRSIANGEREKMQAEPIVVEIAPCGDESDRAVDLKDSGMNPEQQLVSLETLVAIRAECLALFKDDQQAYDMLEGIMEGFSIQELRDLVNLDQTAYESKRKLIRRRLDSRYPNGWKS
jgi:DNA-directed RNA polymerase specialized sigma24 family protein